MKDDACQICGSLEAKRYTVRGEWLSQQGRDLYKARNKRELQDWNHAVICKTCNMAFATEKP